MIRAEISAPRAAFGHCLSELRALHAATPALRAFVDLPMPLQSQPVRPHHRPTATLMEEDTGLFTTDFAGLRDAFVAASPHAHWRETYKGTRLEGDFMERFWCYCLIGGGGAYTANSMSAFVVYMPAGLYYPYHHHPAEELYFILVGEAEFPMEDSAAKTLGPGDHVFHPSGKPHATQTHEHPLMALVLWRGDLSVKPVLTFPEGTA